MRPASVFSLANVYRMLAKALHAVHERLNDTFAELTKLLIHAKGEDRLRLLSIARLITEASDELGTMAEKMRRAETTDGT